MRTLLDVAGAIFLVSLAGGALWGGACLATKWWQERKYPRVWHLWERFGQARRTRMCNNILARIEQEESARGAARGDG